MSNDAKLETHSDLKVSAAAVDDESCQDNEKHNCAMGRATGCSGRYENHFDFQSLSFSFPALVTDKDKTC